MRPLQETPAQCRAPSPKALKHKFISMHRHSLSVCVAGAGAGRRGAEGRQYFIHACQYYEAEREIHIIVMGKSAQQDDAPEPRH